MPDPARILIVRLSHLGDVVCALPVYHAARARWPEAELAWVVQPEFSDLVGPLPGLARTFAFGRRDGARAWWRLRRELRAFGPDVAIDAQGNTKSAAATRLSGAPRRLGPARADWREPWAARFVTEHAAPAAGPHALDHSFALARQVTGAGAPEPRRDPDLTDAERARGRELAEGWLPPGDAPVVLHAGAPGDPRSLPVERARDLARALVERGRPLLLLTGPSELEAGRALERELGAPPGLRHAVGAFGLRDLAALLDAAAARAAVFVGPDSGPMHLAAACGVRVVLLAGPTAHERTGPWPPPGAGGSPHVVVRTPDGPDCAPCLSRECHHPDGPVCTARIAPADVVAALDGP